MSSAAKAQAYEDRVFLNVPFDSEYEKLFDALVFAVHDCGFIARCAREFDNAGETRFQKLMWMIGDCKFGLHDISRIELDAKHGLPRFNMPLELGMFLGARQFGQTKQREKVCLILERRAYQSQKYCSDLAGQDVQPHGNNVKTAIHVVRSWLQTARPDRKIPGPQSIAERYVTFRAALPRLCREGQLSLEELTFIDYRTLVAAWLVSHGSFVVG